MSNSKINSLEWEQYKVYPETKVKWTTIRPQTVKRRLLQIHKDLLKMSKLTQFNVKMIKSASHTVADDLQVAAHLVHYAAFVAKSKPMKPKSKS